MQQEITENKQDIDQNHGSVQTLFSEPLFGSYLIYFCKKKNIS